MESTIDEADAKWNASQKISLLIPNWVGCSYENSIVFAIGDERFRSVLFSMISFSAEMFEIKDR